MAGYWLNGVKYSNVQLIAGENALSLDYWIGNANLKMMVVPESVTSIEGTFQQFPNLAEIVVANSEQVVANLDTAFANTEAVGNDGLFWVADNLLTAYQTAYPALNFDKWTNYTQYTIPYIGNAELTASYVQQLAQANPAARTAATTVIVPVEFTSYESGAITAIQTAFTNMGHLITTYEDGVIDLEPNGDIAQEVVAVGSTLDSALAYARSLSVSASRGAYEYNTFDSNAIIYPPIAVASYKNQYNRPNLSSNIVYFDFKASDLLGTTGLRIFLLQFEHLIEAKLDITSSSPITNVTDTFRNNPKLKRLYLNADVGESTQSTAFQNSPAIEQLLLYGWKATTALWSNAFTEQSLVDLFNSLGTPATQQTLTIGATNLAKLTADDLAIATAKNWVVQ